MKKVISSTMALAVFVMVLMASSTSVLALSSGAEELTLTELSSESSPIVFGTEDEEPEAPTEEETSGDE